MKAGRFQECWSLSRCHNPAAASACKHFSLRYFTSYFIIYLFAILIGYIIAILNKSFVYLRILYLFTPIYPPPPYPRKGLALYSGVYGNQPTAEVATIAPTGCIPKMRTSLGQRLSESVKRKIRSYTLDHEHTYPIPNHGITIYSP